MVLFNAKSAKSTKKYAKHKSKKYPVMLKNYKIYCNVAFLYMMKTFIELLKKTHNLMDLLE